MTHLYSIPCPDCGHKGFQKALSSITIGDSDTPLQASKIIRPSSLTEDSLGLSYAPGELQRMDIAVARTMFIHWNFVEKTLREKAELFRYSQCRIYQFQHITDSGETFLFGTFITDGSHNLIDLCYPTHRMEKRKRTLLSIIRGMCTPESVASRLFH